MRFIKYLRLKRKTKIQPFIKACIDQAAWFGYWHHHITLREGEIKNEEERNIQIKFLLVYYEKILKLLKLYPKPYQSWVVIHDKIDDSYYDSVYIHTENPNANNFPHDFHSVVWDVDPPGSWRNLIDLEKYRVGKAIFNDEISYFIVKRDILM